MLGCAIVFLMFWMVFSKNGLMDYRRLKEKHTRLTNQVLDAQTENKKIEQEISRLQNDTEYIRHLAKHEHEMAEQEEIIFKILPQPPAKPSSNQIQETPAP